MADLMRTSNPALNERAFQGERAVLGDTMTLQGTVNKTGVLLICVVATAAWTWNLFLHSHSQQTVMPLALIGGIGGLIVAMVTIFKKEWCRNHGSDLCAARRSRARQYFGDSRSCAFRESRFRLSA